MTGEAELYAQEEAEIAANDDRLAPAQQATRAATEARARAFAAARVPFSTSGAPAAVAPAEVAALAAVDAEQALLVERTRLHERINEARNARKDPRR